MNAEAATASLVTVVIPAYKAAATIERALRSVLAQPGVATEVVVVVDDLCAETQRVVAGHGPRVRCLVNERNLGAQVSRNLGLAEVTSPFVMFLDGDDFVAGDLLAPLAAELAQRQADFGFGPWIRLDETNNICIRSVPDFASPRAAFERWLVARDWVPPCGVLWRTEFVRRIGGWDERIRRNQDGELVLRAILLGATLGTSRVGAGVYVQHPSEHRISLSTDNYSSLIDVVDKLAALDSAVVPPVRRRFVLGQYLYEVARIHFWHAEWELGRRALRKSRELGFLGHRGPKLSRLSYTLLGLERQQRLRHALRRAPKD